MVNFAQTLSHWWASTLGWLQEYGLPLALVILGAILVARFASWIAGRMIAQVGRRQALEEQRELVAREETKHRQSAIQATAWTIVAIVYLVGFAVALAIFGVDLSGVVLPASVLGVALGFGAQQVVGDLLGGFFIITENQYAIDDVIRVSQPGETTGVVGTVEAITLRTTVIRSLDGEAISIPNGEIRQVANLSRNWSRVVVSIPLAPDQDVKAAERALDTVLNEFAADPDWSNLTLEEPSIRGIDRIDVGQTVIQVMVKTLPGEQWAIGRELRRRISVAFNSADVKLATPIAAAPTSS